MEDERKDNAKREHTHQSFILILKNELSDSPVSLCVVSSLVTVVSETVKHTKFRVLAIFKNSISSCLKMFKCHT